MLKALVTMSLLLIARSVFAQPTIDGTVDAVYGQPLASDPANDYVGKAQWDLTDLYVTHDATHLFVAFRVAGDLAANAADEKNYILYIDTTNDAAGATSDAWERAITAADPHKPEYSINTWVKNPANYGAANVEFYAWSGTAWGAKTAIAGQAVLAEATQTTFEWKIARSTLGNPDRIWLEVMSTGSFVTPRPDNAQDTIPDDWNVTLVGTPPEPDWKTPATLNGFIEYVIVPQVVDGGVDAAPDMKLDMTPDPMPDAALDMGVDKDLAIDCVSDKSGDLPADGARNDNGVDLSLDKGPPDTSVDGPVDDGPVDDKGVDDVGIDVERPDQSPGDSGRLDSRPIPGDGGGDDGGCGCAARGGYTAAAAAAWPLMAAFVLIGVPRRRRESATESGEDGRHND